MAAEALEEGALLGDFSGEEEIDDGPLTGAGGLRSERSGSGRGPGVVRRSSSSGGD